MAYLIFATTVMISSISAGIISVLLGQEFYSVLLVILVSYLVFSEIEIQLRRK